MAAPWTGSRSSIITPEAVELEFQSAGLGSRTLGFAIDLLIQGAALLVLAAVVGLGALDSLPQAAATIIAVVALFLIVLGYPVLSETLWGGRTVGKAAIGLRVRTREGTPIRFRHAAIRGALGLVDFWLTSGAAAALSILLTRDNLRLGDLAAGTLVLRERTAAAATAAPVTFTPPPGWEPYTAALDVGAMTSEQYGLVRSFLLRAHELSPEGRVHLAVRLAAPLAGVLHHQPPHGVHPESFLLCAAAAYQRRYGRAPS
jgi:uncharacterized RDD family membrane protein YckC